MTDIVERLLDVKETLEMARDRDVLGEAADENERLREILGLKT